MRGPEQLQPAPGPAPFDMLLQRCQRVAEQLQTFEGSLDAEQRLELARSVAAVRAAAASLGAAIWDQR